MITGGAGFIGTNLADRLLRAGHPVLLFDNLSRPGVERNLHWLCDTHRGLVHVEIGDVRHSRLLSKAVAHAAQVFHFAAQVSVTTSVQDPVDDFNVNARGTLNLLEALRGLVSPPPLVFTSTNKVYGGCPDVTLVRSATRYEPQDASVRNAGISEARALDFHSPHGCSKGTADQYVLDYSRGFGIPTVVFRMSCIYGPHQCGNEDQDWVAHFLLRAIEGKPLTVYGDGRQVRDVLFVEDLVEALLLAQRNMPSLAGHAFNIGGGPARAVSLVELLAMIERMNGGAPNVAFEDWRPGDQKYYVSDTRKFQRATGWTPRVPVREGVTRLYSWLLESSGRPAAAARREEAPQPRAELVAAPER